ncbi:MAG: hypothetical protein V4594_04620 [Bacteroidota bacterium]
MKRSKKVFQLKNEFLKLQNDLLHGISAELQRIGRPVYMDELKEFPFKIELRRHTDAFILDANGLPAITLEYHQATVRTLSDFTALGEIEQADLLVTLDCLSVLENTVPVPPASFEPVVPGQYISHEQGDRDCWICLCGNYPESHGFYPCDSWGDPMEPTVGSGWLELYRCEQCGRIIDQNTHLVSGINNSPKEREEQ